MAGQFRFKNSSGAIVAQISASNAGAMSFSGSAVDFSSVTSLTLGTSTLTGTASFATAAVSSSYSNIALTGSNAMTASSADTLYVRNNATVLGSITAQTLVVQTVTSSVDYVTGSTRFGSLQANTHIFTGSLSLTGSAVFLGGNVGLGTTSAGKLLHLYATNDNASVRFTNTAASKVWDLTPANPNVANSGFSIYNVTDNTIPFHVTDAGNVGIGTTSPSEVLQVNGSIRSLQTTNDGIAQLIADASNSSSYRAALATFGNTASGNLLGLSRATNSFLYKIGGTLIMGTENSYPVIFSTSDTERMRITSAGNVGIGSTSPSSKLFVAGDIQMNAGTHNYFIFDRPNNGYDAVNIYRTNAANRWILGTRGNSNDNFHLYSYGTSGQPLEVVYSTGQLIVGYGQTGGYIRTDSGYVNETQNITNNCTAYFFYKYSGNANGSSTTYFNITGLSTANGTWADISVRSRKDATGSAINTVAYVQINGTDLIGGVFASGTGATQVSKTFRVVRMSDEWVIVGSVATY